MPNISGYKKDFSPFVIMCIDIGMKCRIGVYVIYPNQVLD